MPGDVTLPLQGLQMEGGGRQRREAHTLHYLADGRGDVLLPDVFSDDGQDFSLSGREWTVDRSAA